MSAASRTVRRLLVALGATALVATIGFFAARASARLRPRNGPTAWSVWQKGQLVARAVTPGDQGPPQEIVAARAESAGILVRERVVADAPLPQNALLFAVSVVSGLDGVSVSVDDRETLITPDDAIVHGAYDHAFRSAAIDLEMGADRDLFLSLAATRAQLDVETLRARAVLRRVRVIREIVGEPPPAPITAETIDADRARAAALEGARYLARHTGDQGLFHYGIDALTGAVLPGYNWTRHAGATLFLAAAARTTNEAFLRDAAMRAATALRVRLVACGTARCFPEGDNADAGVAALALLALVETTRGAAPLVPLDDGLRADLRGLAAFLRSLQRPDGDLWHRFDRKTSRVVEVQRPYFSGEAALALARAGEATGEPGDLDVAAAVLARNTRPRFFGARYWFGEEHWTCQAMEALAAARPDPVARDFCVRWSAITRKMMLERPVVAGEPDLDGAFGAVPFPAPHPAVIGGRIEGVLSTLAVLRAPPAAGAGSNDADERAAIDAQVRHALAFILRAQLLPGPHHLFADPAAALGGIPGSAVDFGIRIDAVQHGCYALLRWAELISPR